MVIRWGPRPLAASARVLIRRYRRSDVDAQCTWPKFEDPIEPSWNLDLRTPAEREHYWRTRCRGPDYVRFAIDTSEGRMIGFVSLRGIDRRRKVARLGIGLSPDLVGRGYGTEALKAFLHYYFETLKFTRIVLDVAASNERAIRCYRKCGFVATGEHFIPFYGRGTLPTTGETANRSYVRRDNRWWMRMVDMELDIEAWRAVCSEQNDSVS